MLLASLRFCLRPAITGASVSTIEGYVSPKGAGLNMAAMSLVESDPFEALGIRVLRGRVFTESDMRLAVGGYRESQDGRALLARQAPIGKRCAGACGDLHAVDDGGGQSMTSSWSRAMRDDATVYQPVTQTVAREEFFRRPGELSAADGWIVLRSRMAPEGCKARSAHVRED